jgi:hypothetical protein
LSPISARKKAASADVNAPERLVAFSLPSYLSGKTAQTATPRKEIPRAHRINEPVSRLPKNVPASPAAA